jgi:site-specific DNA-methyltransferase (adenine-specific)
MRESFKQRDIEIICGDCVDVLPSLANSNATLVIADPPYNVYDMSQFSHAVPFQRRNLEVEFDKHDADFLTFSQEWINLILPTLATNGSMFIFGGVNYKQGNDLLALLPLLREKLSFINLIVWHYPNGSDSRRFFANRYELIAWFARSRQYVFNLDNVRESYDEETLQTYLKDKRLNPETVKKGRNPTNVWHLPRVGGNAKERLGHPTQKPETLIERIVIAGTNPGDLVIDPFGGVGTTPAVCARLGRRCIAIECDPAYYQVAVERLKSIPTRQP